MYKSKNIINILTELHFKQSEIKKSLICKKSEEINADKVEKLYRDKGNIINNFIKWRKTKDAQDFVDNNKSLWNEKVKPLLANEKSLQDLLNLKVKNLASDLRDIHKSKRVLTYYKES